MGHDAPELMASDNTRRGSRTVKGLVDSEHDVPELMASDNTRRGSRTVKGFVDFEHDNTRRGSRTVNGFVDFVLPDDTVGESRTVKGFSDPRTTRLSVSRHNEECVDPQSFEEKESVRESMHEWARNYESARNSVRESTRNSVRAPNLLEILKISQPLVDDLDDQSTTGSQSFWESRESVREPVRVSVHEPARNSPWWSTRNSAHLHRWEMLEKLQLALNNLDDRSTNGSWCGRESVQESARESVRQSVHESAQNSARSPPRGTLRSFCFVPLYETPVV